MLWFSDPFISGTRLQINYADSVPLHVQNVDFSVGQSERGRPLESVRGFWRQAANPPTCYHLSQLQSENQFVLYRFPYRLRTWWEAP